MTLSRIMVALDLSPMDEHLMRAVCYYHAFMKVDKAYFLHIIPDFSMPKEVDIEFQKLFAPEYPIDEKVTDKINLDLTEVFGEKPPFEAKVEVREGQPLAKLLRWVEVKEIDCVVVGRKQQSEGSGITARRVAREAKSNILFVPDAPLRYVRKILVPIDFSENSARAVQQAYAWKKRNPEIQIQGLYLIDLPPTDYYLRPVPRSGFQDILKTSAESAFKKFVKRNNLADVAIEMVYIDNVYSNVAHHIDEFAKKNGADMIVVGAQGHNRLNRFVFGSVTERLAERNHEIPLMIIR